MNVPNAMVKKCFDFDILCLIDSMNLYSNLVFVAVARLREVNRYNCGLHD